MNAYNDNLSKLVILAQNMIFLADKGDLQREDDGCGVLFGVVRDSAYKIRHAAEEEIELHRRQGRWDGNEKVPVSPETAG